MSQSKKQTQAEAGAGPEPLSRAEIEKLVVLLNNALERWPRVMANIALYDMVTSVEEIQQPAAQHTLPGWPLLDGGPAFRIMGFRGTPMRPVVGLPEVLSAMCEGMLRLETLWEEGRVRFVIKEH